MKLRTNFTQAPLPWRPIAAGVWAAALVAIAVAAMLTVDAHELQVQADADRARLTELEARLSSPSLEVSAQALSATRQRVAEINRINDQRGWPTPAVLALLERLLPDQVLLASLSHRAKDGELLLLAESSSADALVSLLRRLEREPHFKEVLLVKQSGAQVEIRLKEVP